MHKSIKFMCLKGSSNAKMPHKHLVHKNARVGGTAVRRQALPHRRWMHPIRHLKIMSNNT